MSPAWLCDLFVFKDGKLLKIEVRTNFVLYGVDPYSKVVVADFQQENMIATLSTLFGVLGLLLAAVGLY